MLVRACYTYMGPEGYIGSVNTVSVDMTLALSDDQTTIVRLPDLIFINAALQSL